LSALTTTDFTAGTLKMDAKAKTGASTFRRISVSALLMLSLSGCVFNNPLDRQLTSSTLLEPSPMDGYQYELAKEVPLSRAFVELPAITGPIIAVREKRYANGVEQIMVLESEAAADGENRVEVRVVQPGKSDSRIKNEYLAVRTTRQEQIRSDFKEFVWGVPMQIVSAVEANAYGTYGYALGRSKQGYNCLLGWQNVKGAMREKRLLGVVTTATTQVSVRVRVCRTDLTEDQLVSIIRGMRITVDPKALMEEPSMIWSNEGYNISGSQRGNGTAPGYVTEGVAMPEPEGAVVAPDVAPIDEQPAVASAPVASEPVEAAPAAPRRKKTYSQPSTQYEPKRKRPRDLDRDLDREELRRDDRRPARNNDEIVSSGDPSELDGLDPMRNQTTIFLIRVIMQLCLHHSQELLQRSRLYRHHDQSLVCWCRQQLNLIIKAIQAKAACSHRMRANSEKNRFARFHSPAKAHCPIPSLTETVHALPQVLVVRIIVTCSWRRNAKAIAVSMLKICSANLASRVTMPNTIYGLTMSRAMIGPDFL
jgi:hypothetical protein